MSNGMAGVRRPKRTRSKPLIAASLAMSVLVLAATKAFYWDNKTADGSDKDAERAVWLGSARQQRQALVKVYERAAQQNSVIGEVALKGSSEMKQQALIALDTLEKQIRSFKAKIR